MPPSRRGPLQAPPLCGSLQAPARRGPLQAPELAAAAVLGGLTVALTLVGWFVPHASAIGVLAVLPMAVIAERYRPRAVVASAVAAMSASFLVAGTGPIAGVVSCAAIGGLVGHGQRRRWGYGRTMVLATVVVGPAFAVFVDLSFVVFASLRKLTLDQIRNSLRGLTDIVARVPHLNGVVHSADHGVNVAIRLWWITLPVILVLYSFGVASLTWQIMAGVLHRLELVTTGDLLGGDDLDDRSPVPVPAELTSVSYRYPGSPDEALSDVSLLVEPGRLLAVLGDNGSGKSTLIRILAGRHPTAGAIERPGPVGLGLIGGTAVVSQRPETQVLGVRVADDLIWGLPAGTPVAVAELLASVGLAGMEDRETATLSGGELQRVAVAAALAHHPRLLLSDESTAMVDSEGRAALTDLLAGLPSRTGTAVVHVTHRQEEVAMADAVLRLERGRMVLVADQPPVTVPRGRSVDGLDGLNGLDGVNGSAGADGALPARPAGRDPRAGLRTATTVMTVAGVSHVYAERTPWARAALFDVDFDVHRGDGLLVVGGNGSGKSTLAWIMAGLMRPSAGRCLLEGERVRPATRRVGLAFQHARLQLQRATVLDDVRHAAGVEPGAAASALVAVGLDPDELGGRPVDRLSGGQMRRVALAGLLAARPEMLILDEPLAGLDLPARESLCGLLADLRASSGLTLVVISHDLDGMEAVCDRRIRLERGRVSEDGGLPGRRSVDGPAGTVDAGPVVAGVGSPVRRSHTGRRERGRRPVSVVLFRQVGGGTPIHRLWAGTKLVAVAALSLTLSFKASWASTGLLAAVVLGAALLARTPLRALPRLPLGFWLFVLVGALLTLVAGGSPYLRIAGATVGFGDLDRFALFWTLSLVLLGSSLMIGWTTSVAEIAPAFVRLGRPLRILRLPVDEWAITLALCVRSFPLLFDELRILLAARRLRPRPTRADGSRDLLVEAVDLFSASLVVALRRAGDMADAMRARGDTTTLSARASGPSLRDAVALTVVLAACVGAFLLP